MEATASVPMSLAPRLNDADTEAEYQTMKARFIYDRKSKAGTLSVEEEIGPIQPSAHRDACQRKTHKTATSHSLQEVLSSNY